MMPQLIADTYYTGNRDTAILSWRPFIPSFLPSSRYSAPTETFQDRKRQSTVYSEKISAYSDSNNTTSDHSGNPKRREKKESDAKERNYENEKEEEEDEEEEEIKKIECNALCLMVHIPCTESTTIILHLMTGETPISLRATTDHNVFYFSGFGEQKNSIYHPRVLATISVSNIVATSSSGISSPSPSSRSLPSLPSLSSTIFSSSSSSLLLSFARDQSHVLSNTPMFFEQQPDGTTLFAIHAEKGGIHMYRFYMYYSISTHTIKCNVMHLYTIALPQWNIHQRLHLKGGYAFVPQLRERSLNNFVEFASLITFLPRVVLTLVFDYATIY